MKNGRCATGAQRPFSRFGGKMFWFLRLWKARKARIETLERIAAIRIRFGIFGEECAIDATIEALYFMAKYGHENHMLETIQIGEQWAKFEVDARHRLG